jgi:hypothetical protein
MVHDYLMKINSFLKIISLPSMGITILSIILIFVVKLINDNSYSRR